MVSWCDQAVLRPVHVDALAFDDLVESGAGEAGVADQRVGDPFGDRPGVQEEVGVVSQPCPEAGGAGVVVGGAIERLDQVLLGDEAFGDRFAGDVLELAAGRVGGEVDQGSRRAGEPETVLVANVFGIEGLDEVDPDARPRADPGARNRDVDDGRPVVDLSPQEARDAVVEDGVLAKAEQHGRRDRQRDQAGVAEDVDAAERALPLAAVHAGGDLRPGDAGGDQLVAMRGSVLLATQPPQTGVNDRVNRHTVRQHRRLSP